MPTYEYQCLKCGTVVEAHQSFSDAPFTQCASCRGKLRKLFSPPAIIFKGKGFHCTDYTSNGAPRKACPAAEAGDTGTCEKADDCKGKCAAS